MKRGGLRRRQPLLLPRQPALDLGPHRRRIQRLVQGRPVGVKDHPAGGALDVDRPAVLAALAVVGHHGIGVFFLFRASLRSARFFSSRARAAVICFQFFARRFRPGGLGGLLRPDGRQRLFLFARLGVLGLDLLL